MTPKDMMVVDANAEALGIPRSSLMENAGRCLASRIFHISKPCKVAIFAGTGGNGGDGFVAARYLRNRGFEVEIFLLNNPSRIKSEEALENWKVLQRVGKNSKSPKIRIINDSSKLHSINADIVVDAILGTGIKGKLREPVSTAIDVINSSKGIKIAVDVPSGLDPLSGEVYDKSVKADFTVTFHQAKKGLKKAKKDYVGDIHICDIGIPLEAQLFTGPGDLLRLKNRDINSHKGQNGRVLVLGGSKDYSGAPALAALSSLASGTDLAVVACPESISSPIRSYSPDLIVRILSDDFISPKDVDQILKISKNFDSLVVGCGLGREDETAVALNELLAEVQKPVVIDADGLKLLDMDLIKASKNDIVLTPHKAEFRAVFGLDIPGDLDDKMEMVQDAAKSGGCTVLLKGAVDIISNGHKIRLNSTGNPGMTVGGTGDCLAGLVGGLMAQGHHGFEAAFLGAYINGRAGDIAAEKYGYHFTATDLLKFIPEAFR